MARLRLLSASLMLLLCAACGDDTQNPTPSETPNAVNTPTPTAATASTMSFHRDIAPIINQNCVNCHSDGAVAPFPLTTYEEVKSIGALVVDSVTERRMPPWGLDGSGDCNEYSNGRWLSQGDIATIGQWFDEGMPEGDIEDAEPFVLPEPPELPWVSTTLDIGVDYDVSDAFSDDYRCFVVDVGIEEDQFLTGFKVNPGNAQLVHHVIVYDVFDDEGVAIAEAHDANDPGPGYACYGSTLTPLATSLVGWAPGTPATQLPPGTGLPVSASRKLVIQIHYNTLVGKGRDRTTVDLQLQDRVDYPAIMGGILDFDMVLPANQADATTVYDRTMADLGLPTDVAFYGVFPHMHTKGTKMRLDYLEGDKAYCQSDVPAWDFNWQQHSFYTRPVQFTTEDRLRLTCEYDTRLSDTITPWGDFTTDEMCLIGLYYVFGRPPNSLRPNEVSEGVLEPQDAHFSLGEAQSILYTQEFGGRSAADFFTDLITDDDGAVYAGASVDGLTLRIGDDAQQLPGEGDALIAKYDAQGQLQWYRLIGGPGQDRIRAVALDENGDLWAVGSTTSDLQIGETNLPLKGARDIFILQYDADGNLLNAFSFGGGSSLRPRSAKMAENGKLYIAGYFNGTVELNGQSFESLGGNNGLLLALSPSGELEVINHCASESYCMYRAVESVDGAIIAAGYYADETTISELQLHNNGYDDGFIIALSQTDHSLLWSHHFGDLDRDRVEHLAVDAQDNIYMTGAFSGAISLGDQNLNFLSSTDGYVAKLSKAGDVEWLKRFGGLAGEYAYNIAATDDGIVVTGNHEVPFDTSLGRLNHTGSRDIFLLSYDGNGDLKSAQNIGNWANDRYPVLTWHEGTTHLGFTAYGPAKLGADNLGGASDGQGLLIGLKPSN